MRPVSAGSECKMFAFCFSNVYTHLAGEDAESYVRSLRTHFLQILPKLIKLDPSQCDCSCMSGTKAKKRTQIMEFRFLEFRFINRVYSF